MENCLWFVFSLKTRAILVVFLAASYAHQHKRHPFGCLCVGGGWWIRTTEVNAQQIYSLPPLAAREIPHIVGHVRDPLELVIGVEPTTC